MNHGKILALASMAVLMLGCKAEAPSAQEANAPASLQTPEATTATATQSATQLLEQKLKKDMPYADLRKIVLAEGWLPLKTEDCKENVGGEALICDQQPETESCSGDGHCNMYFANSVGYSTLKVGTYDDFVKFFEFSAMPVNDNSIACPSQDFKIFLKRFASDKAVQDAFTAPLIKVEELADDEQAGYYNRTVYQQGSNYKDFDLQAQVDGFHVLDGNEEKDPVTTPLDIQPEGKDQYFIKFQYGMSEGNSYRFKKLKDCWYLTEDPEAPSP